MTRMFSEMYFWLLLEAGIVNKSLAVRPSCPGLKLQLTSNPRNDLQEAT